MTTPSKQHTADLIADILALPVIQASKDELPAPISEQWAVLQRIRNIFEKICELNVELLLDRDIERIGFHSGYVLQATLAYE